MVQSKGERLLTIKHNIIKAIKRIYYFKEDLTTSGPILTSTNKVLIWHLTCRVIFEVLILEKNAHFMAGNTVV